MSEALTKVTEALKAEGFGVLTEIDVRATLKNKIDVDYRPYRILGACNPTLAYRALQVSPQVGMLLPCNVTVSLVGDEFVEVSILDPTVIMKVADDLELQSIAREAKERLDRVAASLEEV
jgi:uncharacterized protein (DUF302 family)